MECMNNGHLENALKDNKALTCLCLLQPSTLASQNL